MFNKKEKENVLYCILIGAEFGAGLCMILFVYALSRSTRRFFFEEVEWNAYLLVFSICVVIGFVGGVFAALHDRAIRVESENNIRIIQNHKEVVAGINGVLETNEKVFKQISKICSMPYHEKKMQIEIGELLKAYEQQKNKVQSIVEQYKI